MQEQEQVAFDPLRHPPMPLTWSSEGQALQSDGMYGALPPLPDPEPDPEPEARRELPPLAVFSDATESALQSFFARGGTLSEPSNFAAMCERAQRLSHASYPCPACDSTGSSRLPPEEYIERTRRLDEQARDAASVVATARTTEERGKLSDAANEARKALFKALREEANCRVCDGTGTTTPRKFGRGHGDNVTTACWCPLCEGGGSIGAPDPWQLKLLVGALAEIPGLTIRQIVRSARDVGEQLTELGRWPRAVEILRRMAWRASGSEPALTPTVDTRAALRALVATMRDRCYRCSGEGYVVPIDVRETGNSVPPAATSADASDVVEHGEIDRILSLLRETDPLAAMVLSVHWGIDGNRWGATARGRIWSLMPLTKPGATLARESAERFEREHPGMNVDACELLGREQDEDRSSALVNRRRRSQLDSADKAARNLLEAAKRAWTRTVIESGHDARDSVRVYGHEADQVSALQDRSDGLVAATIASGEHIQPPLHETHAESIAFFGSGRWDQ